MPDAAGVDLVRICEQLGALDADAARAAELVRAQGSAAGSSAGLDWGRVSSHIEAMIEEMKRLQGSLERSLWREIARPQGRSARRGQRSTLSTQLLRTRLAIQRLHRLASQVIADGERSGRAPCTAPRGLATVLAEVSSCASALRIVSLGVRRRSAI